MRKGEERRDESGQAVIEYVLMLAITVGIVSTIAIGFRRTLFRVWGMFSQEISAACPACPPDPRYKLR